MDFQPTIEFEENIKPKLEPKEELLHFKEEKIDSAEEKLKFLASGEKNLSNIGKEIVEMDFAQKIQFLQFLQHARTSRRQTKLD